MAGVFISLGFATCMIAAGQVGHTTVMRLMSQGRQLTDTASTAKKDSRW
jgi:hypothetical protein